MSLSISTKIDYLLAGLCLNNPGFDRKVLKIKSEINKLEQDADTVADALAKKISCYDLENLSEIDYTGTLRLPVEEIAKRVGLIPRLRYWFFLGRKEYLLKSEREELMKQIELYNARVDTFNQQVVEFNTKEKS